MVVPRAATLPQLMRTFQETHRHLALVVDEYGSVDGLATLEDVLEEIVGDIRDESDSVSRDLHRRADGVLIARGTVDLRQISASLGVAWSSDTEATSIGGLVMERLERIPVVGDTVDWNDHKIEVLRADRRRARLLAISRK